MQGYPIVSRDTICINYFLYDYIDSPIKTIIFHYLFERAEFWARKNKVELIDSAFFCTNESLSKKFNINKSYAQECINDLVKLGLIKTKTKQDGLVKRRWFYFDSDTEKVYFDAEVKYRNDQSKIFNENSEVGIKIINL